MKNFTNNPLLSILILLLLTANIVTLALLWTNKSGDKRGKELPPPGVGGGQVFEFVSNELKLASAQREAYKKMRDEHQAGQKPLQDSIRKAKVEFFSLLQQPHVPDSWIEAGSKRASEAEQQLDLLTFKHFQKLRAICNEDQQKKFDEIIQDVLRRMASRRQGPAPGRGDGPGQGGEHGPPPPQQ